MSKLDPVEHTFFIPWFQSLIMCEYVRDTAVCAGGEAGGVGGGLPPRQSAQAAHVRHCRGTVLHQ